MTKHAYYMRFIEAALEMVLVFDRKGNVIYGNRQAAKMLGYKDGWDVKISEIFPEAFSCDELGVRWADKVGLESTVQCAYRKNKTCFDTDLRAAYVREQYMSIVMAQDVSTQQFFERKASSASSRLEDATEEKERFVANVSHEMRTPINGISGNIRMLMQGESNPERLEIMQAIERQCNDMRLMINNVLDFSAVVQKKLKMVDMEFDFRKMMETVKSEYIGRIIDKGLNFFMDISEEIPARLIGDQMKLEEILANLLSNAIKFTPSGKINIKVIKSAVIGDDIELYFMVTDTGIGISKEYQEHMFESFSQADRGMERKYGGMGMGLCVAKQLVELMGGKIRVDSEENRGSLFSFSAWLKVPSKEDAQYTAVTSYKIERSEFISCEEYERLYRFGMNDNVAEIEKTMSKLILCIEMRNWPKAENFMEALRQLTANASQKIRRNVLKLKIAVQKADYDASVTEYERMKEVFDKLFANE